MLEFHATICISRVPLPVKLFEPLVVVPDTSNTSFERKYGPIFSISKHSHDAKCC
jgi:hypothetical protein